jgi:hypothetical protein
LPVSWPPGTGTRGVVPRGPVPIDAIGLGQLLEKHLVQHAPDTRLVPVSQPAPARHPAQHPISAGKYSQGDAHVQHEQDPHQRRPVRHPGLSALRLRRLRREQRRDPPFPSYIVTDQPISSFSFSERCLRLKVLPGPTPCALGWHDPECGRPLGNRRSHAFTGGR